MLKFNIICCSFFSSYLKLVWMNWTGCSCLSALNNELWSFKSVMLVLWDCKIQLTQDWWSLSANLWSLLCVETLFFCHFTLVVLYIFNVFYTFMFCLVVLHLTVCLQEGVHMINVTNLVSDLEKCRICNISYHISSSFFLNARFFTVSDFYSLLYMSNSV